MVTIMAGVRGSERFVKAGRSIMMVVVRQLAVFEDD